jgi:protein tyrosine phosphatase (PTP) superfamily phosphohydrolase (DUF442 family)
MFVSLTLIVAGLLYGYWVLFEYRLTVISAGRVYQSAAMPIPALLKATKRHCIGTVIDFRCPDDPGVDMECRALRPTGIRYVHIPTAQVPCDAMLEQYMNAILEALQSNQGVLVHCKHGEGRAVMYAALYRIEFEGWTAESAYRATTRLPPVLMFLSWLLPGFTRLSSRNPKSTFIRSYKRRGLYPGLPDKAGMPSPAAESA